MVLSSPEGFCYIILVVGELVDPVLWSAMVERLDSTRVTAPVATAHQIERRTTNRHAMTFSVEAWIPRLVNELEQCWTDPLHAVRSLLVVR
jgi:hypothetical protein